jgi:hypothetical protein
MSDFLVIQDMLSLKKRLPIEFIELLCQFLD